QERQGETGRDPSGQQPDPSWTELHTDPVKSTQPIECQHSCRHRAKRRCGARRASQSSQRAVLEPTTIPTRSASSPKRMDLAQTYYKTRKKKFVSPPERWEKPPPFFPLKASFAFSP